MIKNIIQLETQVDGKNYRFLCDHDSQVDHVIEALVQFLAYAKQFKDAAIAAAAASAPPPVETPPQEEAIQEAAA